MKSIILVRHGKSSWEYDVSDTFRPLKNVGISNTKKVVKKFQEVSNIVPEAVFSSHAKRALDTARIFVENSKIKLPEIQIKEQLYDFGGSQLVHFIKGLDDNIDTVLIFGHNNAFTNFANAYGSETIVNVPTSGLVHIDVEIDCWSSLQTGITILTLFPKYLD
ncbi:SixA phosphatase family protein [Formosa sp. S-31]|uniref:SixA phosphatase family protein n=1 Tax=Formosa sp. S-31 TaxID=2790949 RepID=UPI003EBEA9DF